jgi:nucleotide-binding universal stress UspA family protein
MNSRGFGKILFAVDGSSHMRAAAYSVGRLARATHSEVVVLQVTAQPDAGASTDAPSAALERVAKVVARAGVRTSLQTRFSPADEIAETIVAVANQFEVGLVALGSGGLADLSGLFHGSVSHQVIARSDCPVLVVRCGAQRPSGPIRRILLAVAGGEDVPHALEAAMTIARATDAEVLALHAHYLVAGLDKWPFVELDAYAEQPVVSAVRRLRTAGIRAVAHSPIPGSALARTLAREAQAWDADLVVVGSRRLSDLASLLQGGIDDDVFQLSDRPAQLAGVA